MERINFDMHVKEVLGANTKPNKSDVYSRLKINLHGTTRKSHHCHGGQWAIGLKE